MVIDGSFDSDVSLANNDEIACPFFAIREIKGLENKESPEWLKNYLDNIGVGSISPLVDVTNYIAYTFGQPMHAYDADKLSGGLTVETLSENADFKALNDKEYVLENEVFKVVFSSKGGRIIEAELKDYFKVAEDENSNEIKSILKLLEDEKNEFVSIYSVVFCHMH